MNYKEILQRYWGYDDFRGIQREIIESIGSGHDTLGLMPTGGGKSITFQVPALAHEGTCIVITPLIALMKDQVENLRRRGIKAAAIYSGLTHEEIIVTLENAIFGGIKLLYVSPERLSSDLFQTKLRHMKVSFITVDEAHCISQWGYDFRPSYLQIAQIRKLVPGVPVLALTATATPQVVEDIQERLNPQEPNTEAQHFNVFKMSFERKNLAYVVRQAEDKTEQLIHILKHVKGSAIVYARSRLRTKEFAQIISEAGITVKVNTVLVPDINSDHIEEIARTVAEAGADIYNIIPLIPNHKLKNSREPDCMEFERAVLKASKYIDVFRHCQRCRADAVGIPGGEDYGSRIYINLQRLSRKDTFSHG